MTFFKSTACGFLGMVAETSCSDGSKNCSDLPDTCPLMWHTQNRTEINRRNH